MSASERGEEAGGQNPDWMDKNRVKRRKARGELAIDNEAQKGSKRPCVNAARLGGKLSYLIRGGLSCGRMAEVSRGHSSRWSNDQPGRKGKLFYRAKGQTERELSNPEKGGGADSRNPARLERAWK